MRAMLSYESIAPNDLGFEGVVLQMYFLAEQGTEIEATHPLAGALANLHNLNADEIIEFSAFQLDRPRPEGID